MEKDQKEMFDAYTRATQMWVNSFQEMQQQATNAFKLYIQGFEEALKSSNFDYMKKYNEIWQNMTKQFEQNPYPWSQKVWDDLWKGTGLESFKVFFENWQNVWKNFAKDVEDKSKQALEKLPKQDK
ncbi:MAG: hypothetical protein ACKO7N_10005 [Candidatus Nitrosotenuis sp.]